MSGKPLIKPTLEGSSGTLTDGGKFLTNHSPFAPNTDGNQLPPITMENVLYLADEIPAIDDIEISSTIIPFGSSPLDTVELHISNLKNVLLESVYQVKYRKRQVLTSVKTPPKLATGIARPTEGTNLVPNVSIDLHRIFRELGYISGKFNFKLNFHRNLVGSRTTPANLIFISDDRREVSISFSGTSNLERAELVDQNGNRNEFYLNFKLNSLVRISAFAVDPDLSTTKVTAYKLTLQKPLDSEIGLNVECWLDRQMADPVEDTIIVVPPKKKDPLINLRNPNFNVQIEDGLVQSTAFKSWDTILGSNPTSSNELIQKVLSSSFGEIDLNVDYRKYENFVFYGSAVERLKNFKYKLQVLEYYDSTLATLNSATSNPAVDNNILDINAKRNALLGGFDGYEKHLYYENTTYESSSLGVFTPSTWPKSNTTKPYINLPTSNATAQAWYAGQLSSASLYDKQNVNSLLRTIPEFISTDSANESYFTFLNMIGQHFDLLRAYVEQLPNIHSRKEPLYDGLAKDLVYHVLKNLGIDAVNGFNMRDLWVSSLGVNQAGSFTQTGTLQSLPTDDIAKETWKRILNNLPYLLKTKGTERGIRALINCYGVPATVYRVKEYSGPYEYDSKTITRRDRYKKVEKFTYALQLVGQNKNVSIGGTGGALQYRFKPIYHGGSTVVSNNPAITISPVSREIVNVNVGGNNYQFSYDSWISVTITGGNTYLSQQRNGQISRFVSVGGGSPTSVILGSVGLDSASIQVQEVRYWQQSLPESLIKEYCLNPQSILGVGTVDTYDTPDWTFSETYDYEAGYDQLLARYPLGSTLQIFGTGSVHPDQTVTRSPATVTGVTAANYVGNVEDYYVWMPNLGDSMDVANKIRIEETKLDGQLSSFASIEKSRYDTYQLDSPKVGVFFSPQDEINEDIADQFGGLLLDDFIGDPRDDYEDKYRGLDAIRTHYQQKFTGNNQVWKYLRLIENFDASMFYLIKKFLPARSAKMVGLVIQPTLLEKSKTFRRRLGVEKMNWDANIEMADQEFTGEYITYEGDITPEISTLEGEVSQMLANINVQQITLDLDIPTYNAEFKWYNFDRAISAGLESATEIAPNTYMALSTKKSKFLGTKLSGPGFNIPSQETVDGAPVIEYWNTGPSPITNTGNPVQPVSSPAGPASTLRTAAPRRPSPGPLFADPGRALVN